MERLSSESESHPLGENPTRAHHVPTTPAPLESSPTSPLLDRLGLDIDLSSTLAALIPAAQNKHKTQTESNSNDVHAVESPTSLHPAMGLTMGFMNAVAAREAGAGVNGSNPIQRLVGHRCQWRQGCRWWGPACIWIAWYDQRECCWTFACESI